MARERKDLPGQYCWLIVGTAVMQDGNALKNDMSVGPSKSEVVDAGVSFPPRPGNQFLGNLYRSWSESCVRPQGKSHITSRAHLNIPFFYWYLLICLLKTTVWSHEALLKHHDGLYYRDNTAGPFKVTYVRLH